MMSSGVFFLGRIVPNFVLPGRADVASSPVPHQKDPDRDGSYLVGLYTNAVGDCIFVYTTRGHKVSMTGRLETGR